MARLIHEAPPPYGNINSYGMAKARINERYSSTEKSRKKMINNFTEYETRAFNSVKIQ